MCGPFSTLLDLVDVLQHTIHVHVAVHAPEHREAHGHQQHRLQCWQRTAKSKEGNESNLGANWLMGDGAEDVEGVRKELLEFPAITPTPSALPLEDGEPCILQVSDENNARRRVNLLQVQLWITQEERWSRGHHILDQVGNDGERHDVVQLLNVSVVIMLQVLGDLEHLGKGAGWDMGDGRWDGRWDTMGWAWAPL